MDTNSVADVAGSEGNTIYRPLNSAPRDNSKIAKGWCFTLFPLSKDGVFGYKPKMEGLRNLLLPLCTDFKDSGFKIVVGLEICPKTKKEHLQCYVKFDKKQRGFNKIKNHFPKAHIEVAKADAYKNVNYCTKDGAVVMNDFPPPLINKEEEFVDKFRDDLNHIKECYAGIQMNGVENMKDAIRRFVLGKMFTDRVVKIRRSGTSQTDYIRNILYIMEIY